MSTTEDKDLARVIAAMPFRHLLDVAKTIVEMNEEAEVRATRNPDTPVGLAETLSDWAVNLLED